ncbi:MAG: hypothetical protein ACTSXP_07620, partial [Promethearchaeota archaeon]
MDRKASRQFTLAIFSSIILVALIYSLQNLISPGLLTMSYYFGFEGNKSQLATLTFCFTLVSGG